VEASDESDSQPSVDNFDNADLQGQFGDLIDEDELGVFESESRNIKISVIGPEEN
jgi:hypothetical protein